MIWYSHLLKNFPQFVVIHTVKGFGIINKAEVDVFDWREYNQSDFSIDHLVMSMCIVFSSVLEEGVCYGLCVFLAKLY